MILTLNRRRGVSSGKYFTFGRLHVNNVFECWTLEDEEREMSDGEPGLKPDEKVYGKTAIPKGKYEVVITYSNRFKRELPLLLNVPNFVGVRIHPGNTAQDTEGCILVGTSPAFDTGFLGNSRTAFNALFKKLEDAAAAKEKIHIEIL